jgi:hypothetical protein
MPDFTVMNAAPIRRNVMLNAVGQVLTYLGRDAPSMVELDTNGRYHWMVADHWQNDTFSAFDGTQYECLHVKAMYDKPADDFPF